MTQIQFHPTGFINPFDCYATTKILAPKLFRSGGGILLNQKGQFIVI